jgi:hypothetical protein
VTGELTADEHDLLRRAQDEALSGVTFDVEAGLADLRQRASAASRPSPAFRPVPAYWPDRLRARRRIAVVGALTALAAFAGGGIGVISMQAGGDFSEVRPPARSAPAVAREVTPGGSSPSLSPDTSPDTSPGLSPDTSMSVSPDISVSPKAGPGSPVPSRSRSTRPEPTAPAPTRPPAHGPVRTPQATTPSEPPAATPTEEPTGSFPAGPPTDFPVVYAARSLTVAVKQEQPQSIDLEESPRTVAAGDGAVAISAIPDSGGFLLEPTGDVQAATLATASATADECAAAIRDEPSGGTPLTLRDDRTYCLLTPGPPETGEPDRPTLVQLTMDPTTGAADELTVHLTAWNLTP